MRGKTESKGARTKLLLVYVRAGDSSKLDCNTAVFFANTFERSSNARSGANVKTESETREKKDCFAV